MNRGFTFEESLASDSKTTCTLWTAELSYLPRRARLWRIRLGRPSTRRLFHRNTVVGSDYLPGIAGFHPNVGEPVMILVGLAILSSSLVICARNYCEIP